MNGGIDFPNTARVFCYENKVFSEAFSPEEEFVS
jgi:hypothetical protein